MSAYAFGFNPRDYASLESIGAAPTTVGYGPQDPYGGDLLGWDEINQEDIDLDPFQFAHGSGIYPTNEDGTQVPYDQLADWYYNNPEAQQYIDDWRAGGNGDLSQPPPVDPGGGQPPSTDPGGGEPPPVNYGPRGPYGTAYAPGENWPEFTMEGNMEKLAQQDRMQAGAWGDLLEGGFRESQNRYENLEGQAREQAWNGMGGYADILAGRGGYSAEDADNILQRDMLEGGMAGDAEYNANFMTPEEIAAIKGDPSAAYNMAMGNLSYLDDWMRQGTQKQREAISALDTDLNAAVDPTKLGLSSEFDRDYQFTPEDQRAYAEQAARFIGMKTAGERDALERAAAAQGNSSPLAVQASLNRQKLLGDINAGNVYSDALLKGKGLQLDTTANRENLRLGTERDISGRLRDIGSEIRQTQYGMEKDNSAAWNDYGRYQTDLKVNTTGQAEAAKSARAGQLATNRQNANQQNINTRFGQAGTASTALSGRYGQIAGQKKAEEQEGRGFLTGQQDRAQQGAQQGQSNRLSLYGARNSAQQGATGNAISAKNLPGFFDKFAGFIGGATGG